MGRKKQQTNNFNTAVDNWTRTELHCGEWHPHALAFLSVTFQICFQTIFLEEVGKKNPRLWRRKGGQNRRHGVRPLPFSFSLLNGINPFILECYQTVPLCSRRTGHRKGSMKSGATDSGGWWIWGVDFTPGWSWEGSGGGGGGVGDDGRF